MLMLLQAETNAILKEKCYKKYIVGSFCSRNGKMVFLLRTKVIIGYIVIIFPNIRKICLEKILIGFFATADIASIFA